MFGFSLSEWVETEDETYFPMSGAQYETQVSS